MSRGRILDLKNNYGMIDTDAFKIENERIPFKVEKYMLEEKNGKQYIKYTENVELCAQLRAINLTGGNPV